MNIWTVAIIAGLIVLGILSVLSDKFPNIGKVMIALGIGAVISLAVLFGIIVVSLGNANQDIYTVIFIVVGVLGEITAVCALWGILKKKLVYIPVTICFAGCIAVGIGVNVHQAYIDSIPTVGESSSILYDYSPFMEEGKVAALDEESTLKITEDFPVMDGATALYPMYAAFAKAVYPDTLFVNDEGWMRYDNEYLYCSTTTYAYERIVTGEADIIFVASPNENQMQVAKDCGVELVFTPIVREAFVFFVNSKNPIADISLEDVQKIYSGEITRWSELGVKGFGKIKAFQREEGSGSQSTLEKLMAGKNLMAPPKENIVLGMGGIISRTADYKNYKNSIGYSFRFYSTEMVKNDMIKLLSINGVAPTLENIENATYPIASEFYAVTRSDADENTLKLLEWIKGEQGQRIIELTGYTPLK